MCRIKVEEIKAGPEVRKVPKKDKSGTFDVFRFSTKAWVNMQDHTTPRTGHAVIETTSRGIRDKIASADGFEFEAHRLNLPSGTVFSIKAQDNPAFQRAGNRHKKNESSQKTNRQVALECASKSCSGTSAQYEDIIKLADAFLEWLEGKGIRD